MKLPRIFISYSRQDRAWVEAFADDLRQVLAAEGCSNAVFRDDDLESGRSWVTRLQAEGHEATVFALVATPWSLASPWVVAREVEQALARPLMRVAVLRLRDTPPLPPWLDASQPFEFRAAGHYQASLVALAELALGRARGVGGRPLPHLRSPAPPASPWPLGLREDAVLALAPLVQGPRGARTARDLLDIEMAHLEAMPTAPMRASLALVHKASPATELEAAAHALKTLAEDASDDASLKQHTEACLTLAKQLRALPAPSSPAAKAPLQLYLDHVRSRSLALASPLGDDAHAITRQRVYVSMAVGPRHNGGSAAEECRAGSVTDIMRRGRQEGWHSKDCWVLLGDPGAGKTTLLWHLARQIAASAPPPEWVPVLVSITELVRPKEAPADPLEVAADRCGQANAAAVLRALRQLPAGRRLLFLLDGLDEVRDVQAAVDAISGLRAQHESATLLVTSRYVPYVCPGPNFRELALQPFGQGEWRDFLTQWRSDRPDHPRTWQVDEQVQAISDSPALRELAQVPLLLMLLACLLDAKGRFTETNRTLLYEHFFKHVLSGRHRPKGQERPLEPEHEVISVLKGLALSLSRHNLDEERLPALIRRLWTDPDVRDPWAALINDATAPRRTPRSFLEEVQSRTGLLRERDAVDEKWGFGHRSYREALTALALSELPPNALLEFAHHPERDPSAWGESVAMAVAKAADPDALVLALSQGRYPQLAYRALAVAPQLRAETVQSVLRLPSDDVEKRRSAILGIPNLVGEREAAARLLVGLIDEARQAGRPYADDLYFVHEALQSMEKGHPEDSVGQQRRAMFHRLPTPDPALFESIYVPHTRSKVPLMAPIGSGHFKMGSPPEENGDSDERPQHRVNITKLRGAMVVPVTNEMFKAFEPAFEAHAFKGVQAAERPHHPVVNVSWYGAAAFCLWLAHKVPAWVGARLPSEAEWEYIARAGKSSAYWSGNGESALRQVGWYDGNSQSRTHRVGELLPNEWGLFDVHGNVWEWCQDWVRRRYEEAEVTDPAGPPSGLVRVVRGGSWDDEARGCRSACRSNGFPGNRYRNQGFRVVVSAAPEAGSLIIDHRKEGR